MYYKDSVQNKRFNYEIGAYFQRLGYVIDKPRFLENLLDLNELYAKTHGSYPEEDSVWINALCYDWAKALTEIAGEALDLSDESQQQMYNQLSAAELKAEIEERTLDNLWDDYCYEDFLEK